MKNGLTERQKELLRIIYVYIKDTGFPPAFEEMRENLGVSSNQSIIDLLERLKNARLIKRSDKARSIALLPLAYVVLGEPPLVPFFGITAAGAPVEAMDIQGEWKTLSSDVAMLKDNVYLLKITGDSMINAGIDDGDMVLVKDEKEFYSNDIVLAQIGDSSTVKRFVSDDSPPFVYLKPENPAYEIILFTEETRITGKVISVLKNNTWKPVK